MKNSKVLQLLFLFVITCTSSLAQINEGNWMVGGSGNLSFSKLQQKPQGSGSLPSNDVGLYTVLLEPSAGYFIKNSFAFGFKLSYLSSFSEGSTITFKNANLGVSPFLRYYFLPADNNVNVFFEPSISYISQYNFGNSIGFGLKAGHVIFDNNSIGIETAINYIRTYSDNAINNQIFIGIGLQIYLQNIN